jgi:multiple sugar transport system permease protein
MKLSFLERERIFSAVLIFPALFIVAVFAFYPIFFSFFLSLHRIVLGMPSLGEPFVGFENYRELLHDRVAIKSLMNTFIFVFSTTFFEILFGLGMALIINKSFRGRGLVRAAVLIPWAIPTVVSSQMWRFIYNDKYGLLNYLFFGTAESKYRAWLADPLFAFIGVIVADIWKASSFAALLILAGLQTIPDDLYEAARIDGADAWQRFRSITAPLVKPAILIALLFRTMDGFRVFDLIFVMTQGGPADSTNVLQFYGYKKIFAEGLMGYGSAVSVVVFLITLATAVVYIKFVGTRLFRERT